MELFYCCCSVFISHRYHQHAITLNALAGWLTGVLAEPYIHACNRIDRCAAWCEHTKNIECEHMQCHSIMLQLMCPAHTLTHLQHTRERCACAYAWCSAYWWAVRSLQYVIQEWRNTPALDKKKIIVRRTHRTEQQQQQQNHRESKQAQREKNTRHRTGYNITDV